MVISDNLSRNPLFDDGSDDDTFSTLLPDHLFIRTVQVALQTIDIDIQQRIKTATELNKTVRDAVDALKEDGPGVIQGDLLSGAKNNRYFG